MKTITIRPFPVRVFRAFNEESGNFDYKVEKKDCVFASFEGESVYSWRHVRTFEYKEDAIRHAQLIVNRPKDEVVYEI